MTSVRRKRGVALLMLIGLAGCKPQSVQSTSDVATPSTREVANGFLQQMFVDGDVRGAYERYASPDFKQHDPEIADGWAGLRSYLEQPSAGSGDRVNVNNILLVDGDLFALHHHVFAGPGDPGRVVVDIWRVQNGKIVEHWDVGQPIPTVMAHGNGIACGKGDDFASAKALGNTIADLTCGKPDAAQAREDSLGVLDAYAAEFRKGKVEEPVRLWFSSDYRQHSPVIADGVEGAIAFLLNEYGKGEDRMPKFGPMRTVAEGDYVLRHRLQQDYGAKSLSANIDIFRITGGKISEHWDLRQDVPETARNANGMW